MVIGASQSDLSNGHLIFARVGVEFWAILTFTAASKSGMHGYLGSKKLHTPTQFYSGQNLHRRLVFSEVGFPEKSGNPWILAFSRLWELPRTPPERSISLRILAKKHNPQIFSSSVCATEAVIPIAGRGSTAPLPLITAPNFV